MITVRGNDLLRFQNPTPTNYNVLYITPNITHPKGSYNPLHPYKIKNTWMIQPGSLWKMALEVHGGMITCADWSLKIFMKRILGANFLERNISYPSFSISIKKVGSFFFSCQFWLGKKASYFAWHDKWVVEEAFRSSSLNLLC